MSCRAPSWVATAALIAVVASPAAAAGPRVALVLQEGTFDSDTNLVEARLRAELLVSGFEVLTIPHDGPVSHADLASLASASASAAAVSITRSDGFLGAEIWMARPQGASVLRQVRPEPLSPDAPAVVAIRAAEILRASAIDFGPQPILPPPSAAPPNTTGPPNHPLPAGPAADRGPDAPAPPQRSWCATLGASAIGGAGGIPTAFGPALSLSYVVSPDWSLEARVAGPLVSSLELAQGSAAIDQEQLSIHLQTHIDLQESVTPLLLAGFGVHRIGVRGIASEAYHPEQHNAWSTLGLVEAALRVRASPAWALRTGFGAFYLASRPVIAVDHSAVAYAGRPGFHGSLGLELGW